MKVTTITLYIPSVERDGNMPVDQQRWANRALAFFGRVFGGGTALPAAQGVWRDNDNGKALIFETVVMVQCHADPAEILKQSAALDAFCRWMGRMTKQGEVGVLIGDDWHTVSIG
jgi:hypothetical protein